MAVQVSNAFAQNRKKGINFKKPVAAIFSDAKKKHIDNKKLASIAQAAANVNKTPSHREVHDKAVKVAKIARYIAHKKGADYSVKYPEEAEKMYEKEARPVIRQLKLKV